MTAPTFALPTGDPETLSRAAARFGTISGDHQAELTAFNGQVKHALANWRGPIAEQYAVVAGDTSQRFTAVTTALTAMQRALSTYAGALQTAQTAVGGLNKQVAAKSGASAQQQEARSLSGQESAATGTLRTAASTCVQALQAVQTTLAAKCPDTMSAAQFLQTVKNAEARLNKGGDDMVTVYSGMEYMLTSYALFASAKGGVQGAKAGTELTESEELIKALETTYTPAAKQFIATEIKDPDQQAKVLRLWEQLTLNAQKEADGAKATAAIKGGTFLDGMFKAQNIEIGEQAKHVADSSKVFEALSRTSKFDVILAPVTIYFGIHDLIWPPGDSTVEKTGNRIAGGTAAFGGALALATWGAGLFGVTWEIPGVDIATGTIAGAMILAAGVWAAGDAIYDYRHQIWDGTKWLGNEIWDGTKWTGNEVWDGTKWTGNEIWDGTKWTGNKLKDAGETIYHAPGKIVNGLKHLADPLDW